MLNHPRYVSAAFELLYPEGRGFPEPDLLDGQQVVTDAASIAPLGPVFVAAEYGTPFSPAIFVSEDDATDRMADLYRSLAVKQAGPAIAVAIERPCSWGSVILCGDGVDRRIVYETCRPNDRPAVTLPPLDASETTPPVAQGLFLASAGSFNYGHFLVDDLPRLKALATLDPAVGILLTAHGSSIDAVRREAVRAIAGNRPVVFLDPDRLYRFDRLFYVTPVSVHPTHKNPLAIDWMVRAALSAANAVQNDERRLLLLRREDDHGRKLLNQRPIADVARKLGYETIFAEDHGFIDQVRLCAGARVVAGQMGAAMTNAVFAASRARIVHLAPAGWIEPFYWDLAMTREQDYRVLFGETSGDAALPTHQRDFHIDPDALAGVLE